MKEKGDIDMETRMKDWALGNFDRSWGYLESLDGNWNHTLKILYGGDERSGVIDGMHLSKSY